MSRLVSVYTSSVVLRRVCFILALKSFVAKFV